MIVIKQYPIHTPGTEPGVITLPLGATITWVKRDRSITEVFAMVDTEETRTQDRHVAVYRTEQAIKYRPERLRFLNTYSIGGYDYHAFVILDR